MLERCPHGVLDDVLVKLGAPRLRSDDKGGLACVVGKMSILRGRGCLVHVLDGRAHGIREGFLVERDGIRRKHDIGLREEGTHSCDRPHEAVLGLEELGSSLVCIASKACTIARDRKALSAIRIGDGDREAIRRIPEGGRDFGGACECNVSACCRGARKGMAQEEDGANKIDGSEDSDDDGSLRGLPAPLLPLFWTLLPGRLVPCLMLRGALPILCGRYMRCAAGRPSRIAFHMSGHCSSTLFPVLGSGDAIVAALEGVRQSSNERSRT